jgi:Bacterial PH domain
VLPGGKPGTARYLYCMAAEQATDGKAASGVGKPQVFRSTTAVIVWGLWLLFAVANLIDLAVQGRDHASVVAAGILVMITGVAYVAAQRPRIIAADDTLTIRNPLVDHRIPWANVARVDVSDLLRVHCRLPGRAEENAGTGGKKTSKVISAWAVHYSRRRQYSADVKARRDAMRSSPRGGRAYGARSQFGIPQPRNRQPSSYGTTTVRPEPEALKVVQLLNDRIAAARAERDTGSDTILAGYDSAGYDGAGYDSADYASAGRRAADGGVLMTNTWSWRAIVALVIPAVILLVCCLI